MKCQVCVAITAVFLVAAGSAQAELPLNYNVTDLTQLARDTYGPNYSVTFLGVNDLGQVLGRAGSQFTFLISGGSLTEIGALNSNKPGAIPFVGYGLNNLGEVVGSMQVNGGGSALSVPATLRNGVVSIIDSRLGRGFASAISDNGYIAGQHNGTGFLYRSGSFTEFRPNTHFDIAGVNSAGRIVGNADNIGFVSDGSLVVYPLRPQGEADPANSDFRSSLSGVNDAGQIAASISTVIGAECDGGTGSFCIPVFSREVAVLQNANLQTLNMPEGGEPFNMGGRLTGINNQGLVIGVSQATGHGVIYAPLGEYYSYPQFFPQVDARMRRFSPVDISDNGQIIGTNELGRWLLLDPAGGGADAPLLPAEQSVNLAGQRVFEFAAIAPTGPGQPIFFDPPVAVGYEYAIQTGPSFASVLLPDIGDGKYRLELWNGSEWVDAGVEVLAGETFDFLANGSPIGVRRFRVVSIETSAALDPNDPTAFVTGFTFTYGGEVKLTQTSLTVNVPIPEPATNALLLVGVLALMLRHRATHRTVARAGGYCRSSMALTAAAASPRGKAAA
jgi:hypothetical protein